MKSVLIIGMGRFGHHLANNFLEHGIDVMIIDIDEKKIEDMIPYATSTKIGDCTNKEVLRSLGIGNFDIVFVCIGTMGAKKVISKATRDIQAKFLLRNGADEVIYPDKDIAEKCASRYSVNNVFDYIELAEGYAIYEIPPQKAWVGKSIRESNIAARHRISILGIRKADGTSRIMPSADYVIDEDEHLMVLAQDRVIEDILKKL